MEQFVIEYAMYIVASVVLLVLLVWAFTKL